jgi:hypothetical protein
MSPAFLHGVIAAQRQVHHGDAIRGACPEITTCQYLFFLLNMT